MISDQRKYLLGKPADNFFSIFYRVIVFIFRFFRQLFNPPFEIREIGHQCYEIGCRSVVLISLTGFIMGIVFTKQSRPSLAEFGATSWLPGLIAIAIVRALAPLITALVAAGKIGSNIGAELGSMRVTEQIDAMEVSATNPFKFLVVSRVVATSLMTPLLAAYMGFIGLMGAYLNVHQNENTSFAAFFQHGFGSLGFIDIFASLFKSIVYGFTIGIVGCYQGYTAEKGTRGVGKAANAAVVISMFLIFIEEMIIVQLVNMARP